MGVEIQQDIIDLIASCLCFVDITSFMMTCKHSWKLRGSSFLQRFSKRFFPLYGLPPNAKITDVFTSLEEYETEKRRIRKRLVKKCNTTTENNSEYYPYVKKHPELLERMKRLRYGLVHELLNSKVVIAGSFILDVLYDTNYHGDIDVYDRCDPNKEWKYRGRFEWNSPHLRFAQFLWTCGMIPPCHTVSGDQEFPGDFILKYDIFENTREYVEDYMGVEGNNNLLQLIPVPIDLKKCIYGTYDLDICKNSFDGKNLYVRSWNKLFARRDYIKTGARFIVPVYYGDGPPQFDVNEREEHINRYRTEERMKKYQARKFDISIHPQDEEIIDHILAALKTCKYLIGSCHDKMKYVEDGSIDLDQFYLE